MCHNTISIKKVFPTFILIYSAFTYSGVFCMLNNNIDNAIDELVSKQGDGWFIVMEDPESKNYVQFAWGESEGLYFDLPVQSLNDDEQNRAKKTLMAYDIELEVWPLYDRPGGSIVGERGGFSKNIGENVALAKSLALDVFINIYEISPSTKLVIDIDR